MRRRISHKLNSTRGASLILALLFLLVCLSTGAVVLTAASANAGRQARNAAEQQAYLAVSSAMELVKEEFTGGSPITFQGTYIATDTEIYHPEVTDPETGAVTTEAHTETLPTAYSANGSLTRGSLLTAAGTDLNRLYLSTLSIGAAPVKMNYALTVSAGAELPEVTGHLRVLTASGKEGPQFTILVTLAVDGDYTMTMVLSPSIAESWNTVFTEKDEGRIKTTETTCTTTITWGNPQITKGVGAWS